MTNSAVYRLNWPLSPSVMKDRIIKFNSDLRAIRQWQYPLEKIVPHVLVKNNIGLKGYKTSAGAKIFENLLLDDAFCVKQLKSHNVDVFGTTNMTENAGFVTTQKPNLGYSQIGGFPQNPYGSAYPPGGSSTGSAIAVAAGFCDAALGTETRGSLMKPGLANGVFSFKPSRGSISRTGIIPLAISFDSPGVLARNLGTIRKLFHFMAVEDEADDLSKNYYSVKEEPILNKESKTIGLISSSNDLKDRQRLEQARVHLEERGFKTEIIENPNVTFDYKEISSLEFISGIDCFLSLHEDQLPVKNFEGFIRFYRENPDTHPYGMDRLEDALTFAKKDPDEMKELVDNNVRKARDVIENLIRQRNLLAIGSLDFIDWWSIGGGPSLTVPLQAGTEEPPLSIMLGTTFGSDEILLGLGDRLA